MPIGHRNKSQVDKDWESFDPPKRIYSNVELRDFEAKIQRFYEEKEIDGEKVMILNRDKLMVAFGAYTVTEYMGKPYYRANGGVDGNCARFHAFNNLWNQYDSYLQRRDFAKEQDAKQHAQMALAVIPTPAIA